MEQVAGKRNVGGQFSGPYGRKGLLISWSRLRQRLNYDPETGLFTWLDGKNRGKVAGSVADGYIRINIGIEGYYAHRLAFLYMTGQWPEEYVDHKNGVRDDNRWVNLRESTPKLNQENWRKPKVNNSTGLLGVAKNNGRFRGLIRSKGKRYDLGTYATPEEAHEAYVKAKRILHEGGML